jgi:biopolymer transport protein ExbD
MADIQVKDSGGKGGKVRSKKNSGKPDMTPMVDLGFLLITFFMFTTTFSKPNMMKLNMPAEEKEKTDRPDIKISNTITLIMGKDDRLFWHQKTMDELTPDLLKEIDYSKEGIRSTLVNVRKRALTDSLFTVIIKPSDDANFKNTVDILDEMLITKNKTYAIVDLEKKEQSVYEEKIKTPKVGN